MKNLIYKINGMSVNYGWYMKRVTDNSNIKLEYIFWRFIEGNCNRMF